MSAEPMTEQNQRRATLSEELRCLRALWDTQLAPVERRVLEKAADQLEAYDRMTSNWPHQCYGWRNEPNSLTKLGEYIDSIQEFFDEQKKGFK